MKNEKEMAINTAINSLNKKYGAGSVLKMSEENAIEIESIPTSCYSLDWIMGAGIPRGRIIEVFGTEGCLHSDTFINYEIRNKNGRRQNSKGGSIRRLYERFNKISINGSGFYQRKNTINSEFYISSINENDRIIKNKIIDVVKCGIKKCFKITTFDNKEIICTNDHKFYVGDGNYKALKNLKVGDIIFTHNNIPFKGQKSRIRYNEIFVKYHPSERFKIVGKKYIFCRLKKSIAVMEAYNSELEYDEYIKLLNTGDKNKIKNKIKIIPYGYDVHHKNLNPKDDRIENLELLEKIAHYRLHAYKNSDKLRFIVSKQKIEKIENFGETETYDIKCLSPYNNYIANNIVVHNSGKSTLSMFLASQVQKQGGKAMLIDVEMAFDREYASKIGVNVDELLVSQPGCAEEALDIMDSMIRSNGVDLIVLDSVASLVVKRELEGDIGDQDVALQARIMSKALRVMTGNISSSRTCVIFVNQIREKIGGLYWGMKTQSAGGRALRFYSSIRLDVRGGKKIKSGDEVIGNQIIITAVKNKTSNPFRSATLDLIFGVGIDITADIFDVAVKNKIISKSGNTFNFGDIALKVGRDSSVAWLKENLDILEKIKQELNAKKEIVIKEPTPELINN